MRFALLIVEFDVVHAGEGREGDEVVAAVARVGDDLSGFGGEDVAFAVLFWDCE